MLSQNLGYVGGGEGYYQWTLGLTVTDALGQTSSSSSLITEYYSESLEKRGVPAQQLPKEYSLSQNYPNPFNPSTIISYAIPQDGQISLKIYDIVGHEVATLVDGYKTAGRYDVSFDASKLSSGMYIYKIQSGSYRATKKMQIVK